MKIPAEFEDILRGVELTEREKRFLRWITSWDDHTMQNMRTVVEKVRSTLSTLQAENKELRAELEQVKRERDAAVEDLHKLCPAWKWDGEPSNLLTVPFTAGRQTPGCGLLRLSGSTARRRDRYIGNGGDQNGATDI